MSVTLDGITTVVMEDAGVWYWQVDVHVPGFSGKIGGQERSKEHAEKHVARAARLAGRLVKTWQKAPT